MVFSLGGHPDNDLYSTWHRAWGLDVVTIPKLDLNRDLVLNTDRIFQDNGSTEELSSSLFSQTWKFNDGDTATDRTVPCRTLL